MTLVTSELGLGLKSWGQNLRVPQAVARISTIIEQRETFELVFLLLIPLESRSSLARGLQPLTALGTRLPCGAIRGGTGSNHLSWTLVALPLIEYERSSTSARTFRLEISCWSNIKVPSPCWGDAGGSLPGLTHPLNEPRILRIQAGTEKITLTYAQA
jgi:hypothetical protein